MSQSNAPRTRAENRFRPLSSQERLGALVHEVVNEMLRVQKDQSDQGRPIEDFHGDNRVQKDCIRQFCAFDKRVVDLENGLDQFEREVRRLGSSSGLIHATHEVRKHLLQIFEVFRSDSESIYRMFREKTHCEIPDIFRPRSLDHQGSITGPQQGILELLNELSDDLEEFLNSLLDIPEFTDKRLTDSIGAFQGWLEYRAGGLEDFKGDLQTPAVKLYTQSLMEEMITYLKHTENAIESFAKDGVAAIKSAQNRSQVQLQNMSTVATFFSAVTATTYQYLTDDNDSYLDQVVRMLWISSLILSIASAINSQLAMHWRAAMYRSPRNALPMWMSLCLNHTPLLFLVLSVLAFSGGLLGYTYSSSQGRLVTVSATVFTSITSLILLLVICWEAGERWRVSRSGQTSQMTASRIPRDRTRYKAHPPPKKTIASSVERLLSAIRYSYFTRFRCFSGFLVKGRTKPAEDLESRRHSNEPSREGTSYTFSSAIVNASIAAAGYPPTPSLASEEWTSFGDAMLARSLTRKTWSSDHSASTSHLLSPYECGGSALMHGRPFYNMAWRLVRNPESRKHLNTLPMSPYGRKDLQRLTLLLPLTPPKGHGSVLDLRFSPNGRWLAATFADGTAGVWKVAGNKFRWHSNVAARSESIVWSPDSRSLLVRVDVGLMIWCPETGTQLRVTKNELDAFAWVSDGEDFVAAAGHFLWTMDKVTGNHKKGYSISSHPLRIHDVASVPGNDEGKERLLVVVCSIQDEPWRQELHEGFISLFGPRWQRVRPKDVQPQRRIIVYDITRGKVAAAVPIRNEAQHVTVSRNGKFVLISYGHSSPPELWHIEKSRDGKVILELCHVYLDNSSQGDGGGSPDVVGQARFGGDCDEYVVVVTKNGEVYVWDCLSSHLCHNIKDIRVSGSNSKSIGISWCPTNDERKSPLFACGMDDGRVLVWRGTDANAGIEPSSLKKRSTGNVDLEQENELGGSTSTIE